MRERERERKGRKGGNMKRERKERGIEKEKFPPCHPQRMHQPGWIFCFRILLTLGPVILLLCYKDDMLFSITRSIIRGKRKKEGRDERFLFCSDP